MTLGEQFELAIYRFVESVGKGQGRGMDISTVTLLIPRADNVDATDSLIRLHDEGFITLVKYDAGLNPVSYADMQRDSEAFFYRGDFKVTITPRGRLDFERKEVAIPPESKLTSKKDKREFRTALNTYEEQGLLGEGGSGTVHRVRDADGNFFALKLLRKECLGGNRQKRFQQELNFCMKTSHPNIATVLDHGLFAEDCPFFLMPLFDSTLRKVMKQGIEPARIPHIVQQIVSAIELAHGRNIFHRI